VEGTYNVTSYVVPVPEETITQNNLITEIITVVAPPPEANWILLATDPDEGVGTSLKAIYGQLYSDIIYFKVEHYRPWTTINDIDTGIFMDADQSPSTGLPDGFYPGQNTGIGADYVIVVGLQATEMWKWDPIAKMWDLGNPISLAYLDAPDGSNVFVVGVYLASVETGRSLDCAVADVVSGWDWMPDAGYLTLILIRYEHELIVSLEAPQLLQPGETSLLNATVYNDGLNNETNVELQLLINDTTVNNATIPELVKGTSYTIDYLWTPTVEGIYNLTAYAPPVPGENVKANNLKSVIVLVQVLPDILIVNDDDGSSLVHGTSLPEFESALTALGYDYWVWNESSMGNPPLDFLTKFQLVIWTCGDYWNRAVDPTDAVTLESYLAQGGNILLEGEDIGYDHHADDFMANVAHAIYQVDNSGAPGLTVTDPTHPVTFDLPTSFTWLTDPPYDDGVSPTNGGAEVIQYTGTTWTAVTVFEGASNGSVVYYAFPLYCLAQSHGEKLATNSINWLLGIRYEHELAIALEAPDFLEPSDSSLLNATVYNGGLNNETNVELFLLINGTEVNSTTISELLSGSSYTLSYLWTPTVEGTCNVTAFAPPVPGENITINNVDSRYVIVSYAPKILAYVQYTDYDQEYANALGAIDSTFGPSYLLTELWDYTQLDSMLPGNGILFIPEQENADLYMMETIGATWSTTLSNFLNEGGVIILCDHNWGGGGTYGILTGAGLMSISGSYSITGSMVYLVDPSDPLAEGVSNTFIAPSGALSFITSETNVVFNDGTYPVVIHKIIGLGQIALIGFDYFESNPDADRILGNAVGLWTRYEPQPPVANFAWIPTIPKVGESVTFDASASTPNGGTIVKYEWNFSDGETATGKIVTHAYVNLGTYIVTLNVTDSQGLWDIEQKQIQVVQPHGPKAEFTATPETAKVGELVKFDASNSLLGWNGTHNMPITEYRWDFGDGNRTTISTPIVYHRFSSSGIYYVTLTVYAPGATPEINSTICRITVITIPVGGYSISIQVQTKAEPVLPYIALIAILTAVFTKLRPKTRRKR
jgi:PKD repeat protein/archaellum component FlaF (FlaF/FlaG flagellin family)